MESSKFFSGEKLGGTSLDAGDLSQISKTGDMAKSSLSSRTGEKLPLKIKNERIIVKRCNYLKSFIEESLTCTPQIYTE